MLLLGMSALVLVTGGAFAQDVQHRGYMRNDGNYVAPHYQTRPDSTISNNYSTQGNVNPYTGRSGTVNPETTRAPSYPTTQPRQQQPSGYGADRRGNRF